MIDKDERKYAAISIKHSTHDKSPVPVLWGGTGRTRDDEKRCFSGYCNSVDTCEVYSLNDFLQTYGNSYIKCDEPVQMCFDYKKRYKAHDTVLVDIEELRQFLRYV